MASAGRRFTVIDGGTGVKSDQTFIDTGVVDGSGIPFFRPAQSHRPGGTEGPPPSGDHDVDIATLKQRLSGAFLWLGLLTLGSGAGFLFLVQQMNDVSKDLASVQADVAAQSATLHGVKEGVDRVLDRLDKRK